MAENTNIEWAHHTFNPWMGCTNVGPGCDNCYAEADFDKRRHVVHWGPKQPRKRTEPSTWAQPLRWNKKAEAEGTRHRVFCGSLCDVFDNEVDPQWRTELFELIRSTPHLDWLLLTKRIGNAAEMIDAALLNTDIGYSVPFAAWPWPNVWIGATITSQAEADRDIPKLLDVPAAKRFLSMEPLLGPVSFEGMWVPHANQAIHENMLEALDWVIVGGESGPNSRPMHPDWARSLRDQCQAAGVPFLFKQWGEWLPGSQAREVGNQMALVGGCDRGWKWGNCTHSWHIGKKAAGRLLDGREWNEFPQV